MKAHAPMSVFPPGLQKWSFLMVSKGISIQGCGIPARITEWVKLGASLASSGSTQTQGHSQPGFLPGQGQPVPVLDNSATQ